MSIQIIRAPNGDEMVVLPRAEYDALVALRDQFDDLEDAADIAMYDARKSGLAEDSVAYMPAEASLSILGGDSRLRALRKWRGLSQTELAERSGIGQSYFSEIESGRKAGSDETLKAIAKVLDVPAGWIG